MNSGPVWAIVVDPTATVARTRQEISVQQTAGMPPNPVGDTNADVPSKPKDLADLRSRRGPEPLVENGIRVTGAVTLGPPASWTVAMAFSRCPWAWASIRR